MTDSMPAHQRGHEDVPLVLGELFGGGLRLRLRVGTLGVGVGSLFCVG